MAAALSAEVEVWIPRRLHRTLRDPDSLDRVDQLVPRYWAAASRELNPAKAVETARAELRRWFRRLREPALASLPLRALNDQADECALPLASTPDCTSARRSWKPGSRPCGPVRLRSPQGTLRDRAHRGRDRALRSARSHAAVVSRAWIPTAIAEPALASYLRAWGVQVSQVSGGGGRAAAQFRQVIARVGLLRCAGRSAPDRNVTSRAGRAAVRERRPAPRDRAPRLRSGSRRPATGMRCKPWTSLVLRPPAFPQLRQGAPAYNGRELVQVGRGRPDHEPSGARKPLPGGARRGAARRSGHRRDRVEPSHRRSCRGPGRRPHRARRHAAKQRSRIDRRQGRRHAGAAPQRLHRQSRVRRVRARNRAEGTVSGKHGGINHVLVDFPPVVLRKLRIGDRVQIHAVGQGLRLARPSRRHRHQPRAPPAPPLGHPAPWTAPSRSLHAHRSGRPDGIGPGQAAQRARRYRHPAPDPGRVPCTGSGTCASAIRSICRWITVRGELSRRPRSPSGSHPFG